MSDKLLCKDCKHFSRGFGVFYPTDKCLHPENASPVDGSPNRSPNLLRSISDRHRVGALVCGEDGDWWEPKGGGQ